MKKKDDHKLQIISKRKLSLHNGQDKPEIWVAYKGLVYDVSESRLWQKGKHYEHWAGQDLTEELPDAPHTETVFNRFKCIGVSEEDSNVAVFKALETLNISRGFFLVGEIKKGTIKINQSLILSGEKVIITAVEYVDLIDNQSVQIALGVSPKFQKVLTQLNLSEGYDFAIIP